MKRFIEGADRTQAMLLPECVAGRREEPDPGLGVCERALGSRSDPASNLMSALGPRNAIARQDT
jgi:hypothetical protein